jgi:hypothetical protein
MYTTTTTTTTEYTHIPHILFVAVLCKIFAKTVRKIMAKSNKANGMQKYRLGEYEDGCLLGCSAV